MQNTTQTSALDTIVQGCVNIIDKITGADHKKWSPQQVSAIDAVRKWHKNKRSTQIFKLFGYAGTGKTTLAKEIAQEIGGNVVFACFTGKAAMVLRNKGCHGAMTIHSLIYKPYQDPKSGEIHFVLNFDSPAKYADLIIIDEVSMVNEALAMDLLSFKTKVLVLGDPAQLPPVGGEGHFIKGEPDVMLTEVHRQAQENPIIRLSMDIRNGIDIKPGQYGESLVLDKRKAPKEQVSSLVLAADQLICGRNLTRQSYNARIRALKGLVEDEKQWKPVVGDRLVCLKNNGIKSLLNGGLWDVQSVSPKRDCTEIHAKSIDSTPSYGVDIKVHNAFFKGEEQALDWKKRRNYDEFTYGWALTCHKSQGSQWGNIIIFDESYAFAENSAKWLYTAVTRAAEKLTLVR